MTFPEWTKPGVYGALVGAVAVSILGFTWGGWTTAGSADEMARNFAAEKSLWRWCRFVWIFQKLMQNALENWQHFKKLPAFSGAMP